MGGKRTGQDESQVASGLPCPVSSSSTLGGIRGFFGNLISYCPYTMLAKKILRLLRGETGTPQDQLTNRELHLKSQIKIGLGIMLIGVFCPIFWLSYLSGARGNDLMFNAIHSGIVILFGLLYFATYRIQLRNEQVQGKHNELTSQETQ